MSVCLADPASKPVHELRSQCRRVEAIVVLLSSLPHMPAHGKQAERLLRQLRYIRRAAGRARDLDMQRKLLKTDVLGGRHVGGDTAEIRKGAKTLLKAQKSARTRAVRKLLRLITERQPRVTGALEKLITTFGSAEEAILPTQLMRKVERSFLADRPRTPETASEDDLHSVRKLAKRARYQAESAPASPLAQAAAERFQDLQKSGGEWHDWLQLGQSASKALGNNHPATLAFFAERDRKLKVYLSTLQIVDGLR